jgi:hypothetical protein
LRGGSAIACVSTDVNDWVGADCSRCLPTTSPPPPDELEQALAVARKYDAAGRDELNRILRCAGEKRVLATNVPRWGWDRIASDALPHHEERRREWCPRARGVRAAAAAGIPRDARCDVLSGKL